MLTIESIHLRNFLAYRDQQIMLPAQGVTLISGRSGAGKTALAEALAISLGGLRAGRGQSAAQMRRQDAPDDEEAFIEVSFICLERQITVHRDLSGKNTWLNDSASGRIRGAKAVDEHLKGLLGGLDPVTYQHAFYSPQGELDALVRQAPAARRRQLRRLLHLNLMDDVLADVSGQQREVSGQHTALSEQLTERDLPALEQQNKEASNELAQRASENKDAQKTLAELESRLTSSRETCLTLRAAQQTFETAREQQQTHHGALQRLDGQASSLRHQLEELPPAGPQHDPEQLQQQLNTLEEQQQRWQQQQNLLQQMAQSKQQRRRLRRSWKQALRLQQRRELGAARAARQLSSTQGREGFLNAVAELTASSLGEGSCSLCQATINNPKSIIELQQSTKVELSQLLCSSHQPEPDPGLPQQRQLIDRYAALLEQAVQLREQLKSLPAGENNARQSRLVHQQLLQARENRSRSEINASLTTQLTSTEAEIAKLLSSVPKAPVAPDSQQLSSAEQAFSSAGQLHSEARAAAAGYAERSESARRQLEQHTKHLLEAQALKTKTSQAATQAAQLSQLHSLLEQFRSDLITKLRPALAQLASRHLRSLSDGRLSELEFTDEWDLQVTCDAQIRSAALLSGGEQARAALALRLALCELLSAGAGEPPGFLVLDEALSSQDHEHRQAILSSLSYVRAQLPQVLIISHEESLQSSELIDHVISVNEQPTGERRLQLTGA